MSKWKLVVAILVVIGIVTVNYLPVEAAENEVSIVHVGRSIELLSEEELSTMSQSIIGNANQPMSSNASYSVYRYTDAFEYYIGERWLARADAECIVWHYTDGKVHLYQRSIQLAKLISIGGARIYGNIVNTDGSYSYTTGDRVYLYLDEGTLSFAIDFYVSGDDGSFTSYRVYE